MSHVPTCRRGYFLADGWHDGEAPPGVPPWHSATCEGPQAQIFYGRAAALSAAPAGAEPFPFSTEPNLEERAMRFGMAMQEWVRG